MHCYVLRHTALPLLCIVARCRAWGRQRPLSDGANLQYNGPGRLGIILIGASGCRVSGSNGE